LRRVHLVKFLIGHLGLTTARQVFAIITKYCPVGAVPAKTRFFVEEILPAGRRTP
jgi:hypothetical protein